MLATRKSDFSTRQPGHAAVWSLRAAWLPGSLVLLQDGPATWADWTSGATWLLGSLISVLDSLGRPGFRSSRAGWLPGSLTSLLGCPALWVVWRSRAGRLPGSLLFLLDSPAARAIWSSRAAWLPRSLVFYGSLATRRPGFSTGQPGYPGCRVYWGLLATRLPHFSTRKAVRLAVWFLGLPGAPAISRFPFFCSLATRPVRSSWPSCLPSGFSPPPLRQSGHPDWLVWRGCLAARWPSVSHQFGRLVSLVPAFSRRAGRKIPPDSHMRGTRR